MAVAYSIEEVIVLAVLLAGYGPIVRAYLIQHRERWLFAAYTALVVGRIATVAEGYAFEVAFNFIEHSVGVFLAGWLFFAHFYVAYAREPEQPDEPLTGSSEGPSQRTPVGSTDRMADEPTIQTSTLVGEDS